MPDPDPMTIVTEALERADTDERAAYLDRACGRDTELRQRVEALLATHAGAGQLLDRTGAHEPDHTGAYEPDRTGVHEPDSTGAHEPDRTGAHEPSAEDAATRTLGSRPATSERPTASDPGEVIAGRYTLVEVIGEGGMGSVYLASQSEPVKRQVALKLIKAGMDSRAVLARFDAERQALALMDHPNIARIYDGGVTDRGQPFFVMELVQGVPLTDYCDAKRLTVDARLHLFVQVCHAVQHAHQKGIIHRDLKPGNVLVTEVDGRPTPKVIDFGVAKATEQKLTDSSFNDVGAIVGTPAYMSPEQADPSSMDIDTRTDVYALGVMLYELLTGSPPIDSRQFKRGALLEMLRMVREAEPPRPSTKLSTADALPNIAANRNIDPARLSKLLQGELDWVVMKALEKDRTRRYDTANGLARDLQRYLADEVVEARPPSRGYRLKKFVKRNKPQVVAASLVLLALVGGIVGTSAGMMEARRQTEFAKGETAEKEKARRAEADRADAEARERGRAEAAEADAKKERARAEESAREALERLAQSDALSNFLRNDLLEQASSQKQATQRFRPKPDLTVREALDRAAGRVGAKFADRPRLEAAIRHTLGTTYISLAEVEKALPHLRRALRLLEETVGPDHDDTLKTNDQIGYAALVAGKPLDALAAFTRTHDTLARTKGPTHTHTLAARSNQAQASLNAGRTAKAVELFEQVRDARLADGGPDHHETLEAVGSLAGAYMADRRYAEAVKLFEQVRDRYVKSIGPDHPNTLIMLSLLAGSYIGLEQFAKAEALLRDLLERSTRVSGANHPETLMIRHNLAECLLNQGDVRTALREFEALRELTAKSLGPDHPDTALTLCNVARCYLALGRTDDAQALFEKSLASILTAYGPDHPETLGAYNFLGNCYWQQKRFDDGAAAFEKLLAGARKLHGDRHEYTVSAALNLALNYRDAKHPTEAARVLAEWLDRARELKGLDPDFLLAATQAGAACFAETGRNAEATRCLLDMVADYKGRKLPMDARYASSVAGLAQRLLDVRAPAEAEPLLREALAIREKTQPDTWTTFNTQSVLGGVLLGRKKYADAEPLLLSGYEGMKAREKAIPPQANTRIPEALDRLIDLYTATSKPDQVRKWREERAKYPTPTEAAPPPREKR